MLGDVLYDLSVPVKQVCEDYRQVVTSDVVRLSSTGRHVGEVRLIPARCVHLHPFEEEL